MPKSAKKVFYGSPEDLRNGVMDPYNIQGYYTYGSGQTICILAPGAPVLMRLPKEEFKSPMDGNPSISTLQSPHKTVQWLIEQKIVQGKYLHISRPDSATTSAFGLQMKQQGYVPLHILARTPRFERWRRRIVSQCKTILNDRSSYREDSKFTESVTTIKQALQFLAQKQGMDCVDFEKVIRQAFNEFIVEEAMKS